MDISFDSELCQIFRAWKDADKELDERMESVREWMLQVGQLGIPRFGETASRLRPLLAYLRAHFEQENTMVTRLADSYPDTLRAISAVKRQAAHDHEILLDRLTDLIERLEELEPPFASCVCVGCIS